MGAACPLPRRVPYPGEKEREYFSKYGITFGEPGPQEATTGMYSSIHFKGEGKLVNQTDNEEWPKYDVIGTDADGKLVKVGFISGSWKGSYDNNLWIRIEKPSAPKKEYTGKVKESTVLPNRVAQKLVLDAAQSGDIETMKFALMAHEKAKEKYP